MSKQTIRNHVRVLNKHVTNKLLIHIAGKKFGHFAILSHIGRKSGKLYKTPIIAEPIEGGFVIALTYGKKVDWLANVMAKSYCDLFWKKKNYRLINPMIIDRDEGLKSFPSLINRALRMADIEYFVKLSTLTVNENG
jgi:deazaflavin-dependent oxidoreductase (nitroreductase family)